MPVLYRSVDALLHPTLFESFGNIYIEAMASGLPVVAHASEVTKWIFGEGTAGLIDATDGTQMTSAVADSLRRPASSQSRFVEAHQRFSWSTVAQSYRQFFEDVVAATRDSRT
jgi:glycosyltransferase involved in cell wall biosynthesis